MNNNIRIEPFDSMTFVSQSNSFHAMSTIKTNHLNLISKKTSLPLNSKEHVLANNTSETSLPNPDENQVTQQDNPQRHGELPIVKKAKRKRIYLSKQSKS